MWWVKSNAAEARAPTSSLEEALALSAHFTIRGQQVKCIGRGETIVMDAAQIRDALGNLDNAPEFSARLPAHVASLIAARDED
jgi:hypothetical protein